MTSLPQQCQYVKVCQNMSSSILPDNSVCEFHTGREASGFIRLRAERRCKKCLSFIAPREIA